MESDLHLLARYHRHGDAEAFHALMAAHAGMVHATAQRVTRDMGLAQDVVQETFLALARSSGAAIQSVGAWLHHVAWQKAQNVVRGEARRQSYESAAAAHPVGPAADSTWAEIEPFLDEALAELPETTRALLIERYLEGRTQQELAARLGISQPSVSRHLDAALNELRSLLRAKGVLCGAGLSLLLSTHSASAAPASVAASLGKLSISGLGTKAAITPGVSITTALIAMTTTTKTILAAAVAIGVCFVAFRPPGVRTESSTAAVRMQPAKINKPVAKGSADTEKHRYRPAPVTREVAQTVEAIIQRHHGMTKAELQKSAELNKLMDRFIVVMGAPEMQAKLEQRVAALPAEHGTVKMDFELLDDAHGRAWLEAAVSDDPQRIEEWLLNTLDGAIFEFAFDPNLERTSNGVSLQPSSPSKPETPGEPNPK